MTKLVDKYGNEYKEGVHKLKKDGAPAKNSKGELAIIDGVEVQEASRQEADGFDENKANAELEKALGTDGLSNDELAKKVANTKPTREQIIADRMQIQDPDLVDVQTYDPTTAPPKATEYVYDYDVDQLESIVRGGLSRIVKGWGEAIRIEIDRDEMTFHFFYSGKCDSGTLKQPIRIIQNCARIVCASIEVKMDGDLQL